MATIESSARPVDGARAILRQLSHARLKRRESPSLIVTIAYMEMAAFFFCYVVFGITLVAGDTRVDPAALDTVRSSGAAAVGLVVALAFAAGIRSGSHGGPLNLARADVLIVLASPIKPALVLRPLVWRHLVISTAAGIFAGAATGVVASLRLPGDGASWISLGALFGGVTGALYSASASAACAARIKPLIASLLASGLIAASCIDLLTGFRVSPATWFGFLALMPLQAGPAPGLAGVALVLVLALALMGWALIGNASIENIAHRSALVGVVEFAAAREDFRVAWVQSRRLAGEQPRRRPWFGIRIRGALAFRFPVWSRDFRGILRLPFARIARLLLLATAAGLFVRLAVGGTTLALLAAGLCLYLASVESLEGLAADQDQLTIPSLLPLSPGRLLARHLAAPALLLVVLWAVSLLPSVGQGNADAAAAVAVVMAIPVIGTALVAAGMTLTRHVTPLAESMIVAGPPEITGSVMLSRAVLRYGPAPVLVAAALLPALLVFAHPNSQPYWYAFIGSCAVVTLLDVLLSGWWLFLGPAARRRNRLSGE